MDISGHSVVKVFPHKTKRYWSCEFSGPHGSDYENETPCSLVARYQRFEGIRCLHLHCRIGCRVLKGKSDIEPELWVNKHTSSPSSLLGIPALALPITVSFLFHFRIVLLPEDGCRGFLRNTSNDLSTTSHVVTYKNAVFFN